MIFKRWYITFIFLALIFQSKAVFAQRTYANVPPSKSTLKATLIPPQVMSCVINEQDAANSDNSSSAFIYASSADAWLQLKYEKEIPAGKTTFVRIEIPNLTKQNLNSIITVEGYKNASSVNNGVKLASTVETLFTQNGQETYLAVTPIEAYNSVRIILHPANTANIYNAFTDYDPTDCGTGWTTSYKTESLEATIIDPASTVNFSIRAVDDDKSTFSTINIQDQQKQVIVSQTIYFSSLGNATDLLRLYLSEPAGISRTSTQATAQLYYNNTPAGNTVDILKILSLGGTVYPLEIAPGIPFDRVTINITLNSNANHNYSLNIHEAQVLPVTPILSLSSTQFCQDETEIISISNPIDGLQYNWYDGISLSPISQSTSYSTTMLPVGVHEIKVTASRPGCPQSTPATATITINPKPITPEINPIN